MLLRITRHPRRLVTAAAVTVLAAALFLLFFPLPVQADPEIWYLRSNTGAACGLGDQESLNQSAGAEVKTKVFDGNGDTWNRTETVRTIVAGTWQFFFDATTGSGTGSPNKVTVLVERRNSSCEVQGSPIINKAVATSKGATEEFSTNAATGAVTFATGDILTVTLTQTSGGQTVTLRYDNAAGSDADSRLVHPAEEVLASESTLTDSAQIEVATPVSDTGALSDSAQSALAVAVSEAAGVLTESIARVIGINFSLADIPSLLESIQTALTRIHRRRGSG